MGLGQWFKEQLFSGKIVRTLGSVTGVGKSFVKTELKVHALEGKGAADRRLIGLEFVARSFGSYQMTPLTLSRDQANQLAELLQRAGAS